MLAHVPLRHLHSPGQSRASLQSETSSEAEPETGVWGSSAARFSLPWCSFAKEGKGEKNKFWEVQFFAFFSFFV